ncbi:MAG: SDR family NAD(P)-dependent oxidoreductase [Lautropia sp.]
MSRGGDSSRRDGLDGAVVIVTGGTSGIGLAIARHCLAAGASVVVTGRSAASVDAALARLDRPACARGVALDLEDAAAPGRILASAVDAFGRVDCLVNNAGVLDRGTPWELEPAEWDRIFAVNLRAAFFCSAEFVARARAAGHGGAIVNVSSVAGQNGGRVAGIAYAASKAGMIGLTRSLSNHCAPLGIRVNCIAPADIETPMTADWSPQIRERLTGLTPMGRFGEVDEVAAATVFLLGSSASYITGQTLNVNGGLYMS